MHMPNVKIYEVHEYMKYTRDSRLADHAWYKQANWKAARLYFTEIHFNKYMTYFRAVSRDCAGKWMHTSSARLVQFLTV